MVDQLSEVFDLLEVRGQVSGAFAVRGRWVTRSVIASPLKLTVMVRGRCWLSSDGLDARWPTHHENVHFYGTHSVDIDGELAQLDTDGYRPLLLAQATAVSS